MMDIEITGASAHNLKNISLRLPRRNFIVITGVSGSGKSSLAYDTLFQEGQRKYLECLSINARQLIKSLERPCVQSIRGIAPAISIDQKHASFYYNSTVGAVSGISQYLRLLFARAGRAKCPECGRNIDKYTPGAVSQYIFETFQERSAVVLAPVVKHRKGQHAALFEKYLRRGFLKVLVDGDWHYIEDVPELDRHRPHYIAIQVDALKITENSRAQLEESLSLAAFEGDGEIIVRCGEEEYFFSGKLYCPECNISLREPQPALFSLNSPAAVCPECKGRGELGKGTPCVNCAGTGYNRDALSFYFRGCNISRIGRMEITELLDFFRSVVSTGSERIVLGAVLPNIISRLEALEKLNLGYITLERRSDTLSGGELQRARLVSQIGAVLSGVIYILDEPSIGMHMSEQEQLVDLLKRLKNEGNTVVVVEHDEQIIRSSDYVVDLGPGSGAGGGSVVYAGPFSEMSSAASLTADYLFGRKTSASRRPPRPCASMLRISGLSVHNVRDQDFAFPLQALTVVAGVSGSGKSSWVLDALYPLLRQRLMGASPGNEDFTIRSLEGVETLSRVYMAAQSAIGRNARSCPATYIGVMPIFRELFAGLTEAKIRGYDAGRFSFNTVGGRCEACRGLGVKTLEMSFLPDLDIPCPVCNGARYHSETLAVRYNGCSIADVLAMTADEAYQRFLNFPEISRRLRMLMDIGLGYLQLGQSASTLSGGESQRIKLCKELARPSGRHALFLLDEPTVGLHFDDVGKLIHVFQALIDAGNTVLIIEHNPEVIAAADYIVEMGPKGGAGGGRIIYQGSLPGLLQNDASPTANALKKRIPAAERPIVSLHRNSPD